MTRKISYTKYLKLTICINCFLTFTSVAQGAIVWEITEDLIGGTVTMKKSGFFSDTYVSTGTQFLNLPITGNNYILNGVGNLMKTESVGVTTDSLFVASNWMGSGDFFGYDGTALAWDNAFGEELSPSESASIVSSMTRSGTIASSFGTIFSASSPDQVIWTSSSNALDTISVTFSSVPEPSTPVLLALGFYVFISRRRRA
ncbi:MAG: PEP-CTERM sorting domain-containing protein [Akkermansiaceae bacterium]